MLIILKQFNEKDLSEVTLKLSIDEKILRVFVYLPYRIPDCIKTIFISKNNLGQFRRNPLLKVLSMYRVFATKCSVRYGKHNKCT